MDRLNRFNANYFTWINDSVVFIVRKTVSEYRKIA